MIIRDLWGSLPGKKQGVEKQQPTFFLKVTGVAPCLGMNRLWRLDEFLRAGLVNNAP